MNLKLPSGRVLLRKPDLVRVVKKGEGQKGRMHTWWNDYVEFWMLGKRYKEYCESYADAELLSSRMSGVDKRNYDKSGV